MYFKLYVWKCIFIVYIMYCVFQIVHFYNINFIFGIMHYKIYFLFFILEYIIWKKFLFHNISRLPKLKSWYIFVFKVKRRWNKKLWRSPTLFLLSQNDILDYAFTILYIEMWIHGQIYFGLQKHILKYKYISNYTF